MNGSMPVYRECDMEELLGKTDDEDEKVWDADDECETKVVILWNTMVDF